MPPSSGAKKLLVEEGHWADAEYRVERSLERKAEDDFVEVWMDGPEGHALAYRAGNPGWKPHPTAKRKTP